MDSKSIYRFIVTTRYIVVWAAPSVGLEALKIITSCAFSGVEACFLYRQIPTPIVVPATLSHCAVVHKN